MQHTFQKVRIFASLGKISTFKDVNIFIKKQNTIPEVVQVPIEKMRGGGEVENYQAPDSATTRIIQEAPFQVSDLIPDFRNRSNLIIAASIFGFLVVTFFSIFLTKKINQKNQLARVSNSSSCKTDSTDSHPMENRNLLENNNKRYDLSSQQVHDTTDFCTATLKRSNLNRNPPTIPKITHTHQPVASSWGLGVGDFGRPQIFCWRWLI